MKIVFIADIHGNVDNLRKIYFNCEKLVVLGDLFGPYYQDNLKVKDFLENNKERLVLIKGNCDSKQVLDNLNIPYYSFFDMQIDNLKVRCTHGNILNMDDSVDVIIFGHKHYPIFEKEGKITKICVGSISYPRGGSVSSYCVYENHVFKIMDIDANVVAEIKL